MKKLMIAAAIVCAAAMSYGAAANWSVSASNLYNGKGAEAAKLASGTVVYVFDYAKIQQDALFSAFAENTALDMTKVSGYAGKTAIGGTAGVIPTTTSFAYGNQSPEEGALNHYDFYFAIVDGGNIFLSKTVGKDANKTSTAAAVGFGTQAPTEGPSSKTLPTQGFVAAGQWATTVPEPTTGLLMLLGMAGLALRRRRA